MKKKLLLVAILCMSIVVGIPLVSYGKQKEEKSEQWGKVLETIYESESQNSEKGKYKLALEGQYADCAEDLENIYEAGDDILITDAEVQQAQEYYQIAGDTEKEAEQKAIDYVEEQNALYVEAVKNGFDVTDEEVKAYIEELKESIENSENKDEVMGVINAFDSEEAYWEYEFEVYKKLLPIQKYVKSLEKEYIDKHMDESKNQDVLESWDNEFEKVKEELVEEQNYERVKNDKDIGKEFVN